MNYTDEDLETMKPSSLVRLMVEHAKAFDARVQLHPYTFGWDMNAWLSHADIDPKHKSEWPECVACIAGAMLHARGERFREVKEWMLRVNNLRTGCLWAACHYTQRPSGRVIETLKHWFIVNCLAESAAHDHAWNSEDDEGFYSAFADKLEEAGL